ncbi:NACHT, LRR and PYD domains-containing protein [Seminavis robusta]|uniref:NACHT, LRR and PYD domains-containing protein n=1 Tax=Seminavis robusta TaxID=568900 RepID=A0A9N8EE05_9STRA|nr:NACHT, LRR and PYD domains-containing protein [Seminavis robusta]|eukprot:Sro803_g204790.1 NACHT, LRR and PYD domains-containing protein (491) ;mRNA; r:29598-31070
MMDHIAQQLQYQPGFRFLELERSVEDDEEGFISMVSALVGSKSVRHMYLCGEFFDSLDDEQRQIFLEATGTIESLQCLYMANAKLSMDSVEDLAVAFAADMMTSSTIQEVSLQHLNIPDTVVLDDLVRAIAKFPVVERVEIGVLFIHHDQAAFSPDALADLCQSKSLKALTLIDLRFDQDHFKAMEQALSNNHALAELSLWGEILDFASCTAMAKMLRRNRSLESLCIYFGNMNDDGIQAICQSIGQSNNLKSFSIENEDDSITQTGVSAMAEMLEDNKQLETLSLATKALDSEGFIRLGRVLKTHPTLRELSLDNSTSSSEHPASVQKPAIASLSNMLEVNTSIRRLDLSGISMDDTTVALLASSLKTNSKLQELSLGSIKLQSDEEDEETTTESKLGRVFGVLEDLVEHNTVLEKISTEQDTLTLNFGGKINFLLSLNQRGLRTAMVDVNTHRKWFANKLAESVYCVSTLFYLLSMNPSLMVVPEASA